MSIKEIFEIELKFDDTAINIPRVVRQFEELEESERQRLGYVQRLDIAYKRLGVAVKQAQNPTDAAKYAAEQRNIRTQINSITKASQTQLGIINRLKAEQKELTGLRDSSEDTTQIRKYNTQLKNTREELRKIRETQSPANFLFEQNFKANAAALGLQFAVNGFRDLKTEVIEFGKEAIIVTKDYDRLVKTLGAVSRAAPDDLKSLDTNARALGRSTQFTADQVAGLQLEFARLGFTPAKILASTADSLNLAAVSGGELNQVAKLVGATLNAFQLESTEAGRVTDVLSLALSSSAFNFGTLQTALSISAPIASQANVSLEKTTALLGVLVDVGIDASTAGTSLRNIFIKLSTQGLTLEQALEKINTSTDKNKTAFELFGTRGATTASVLASTIPKWQRLNRELEASAGFAKQAGDAITDDLQGDFDRASAAVEGLQINLTNLVKGGIRDLTQGFTSVTNSISDFLEVPLSEELLREESAIIGLVGAINTLEGDRESQIEILNEIKRINPDIVAGYSNEDDAIKGLLPRLRQYISLNQERVAVASQQGRVDIEQSNLDESLERINRARRIASKRINNALRDADLPLIGEGVFSDESLEQAFQRFRDTGQRFARFGETLKLAQLADSDVDISALTKEQNELLKVQKQKRQAQLEFDEQILNTSQESLLNLKSELETSEQRNASEAVLSTLKSQISAQESIVEEKRISVGKRVLENLDSEIALLKTRSAIKLPENATPQDVTEAQAKQIENEKELNRLIKDRFDLANSLGVSAPVNLSQDELDEIRKNQLEQSALEKSAAEATAKATKEAEAERKRIAKKKAADEERERKRRLSEQKKFNDQINKLQFEADNLSAPLSVSDSELGKAEEQIGKSVDRITRRISEVKRKINESVDLDAAQKSKFISDLNDVLDKQETFIRAQGDIKLRNVLIKIVTDVEVENAELNLNEAREKLEDEFDIIEFETEQSKNTISQFFSELRDDINNTSLLSTETRTEFIDQLLLLEKEQNEILERQRAQRNQDVRDTAVFEVETNVREDFRLTSSFSDIDKEEADAIVRLNEQRRKELISYEDYEKKPKQPTKHLCSPQIGSRKSHNRRHYCRNYKTIRRIK